MKNQCELCKEHCHYLFPIDTGYYTPIKRMVCYECYIAAYKIKEEEEAVYENNE